MILRRINQHVKDQNWFAVALDFIIVVAGILLAFKITEWNQTSKDRALEKEYLVRFASDLDKDTTLLKNAINTANSRAEGLSVAFDVNANPAELTKYGCKYWLALSIGAIINQPTLFDQTLKEVLYSRGLTLLKNKEFKNAIGVYYNEYDKLNLSATNISERVRPLQVKVRYYTPIALARESIKQVETVADLTNLSANNTFNEACDGFQDDILTFYNGMNNDLETAGLMQTAQVYQLVMKRILQRMLTLNQKARSLIDAPLAE